MKLATASEAREYGDKQPLPGLTGKVKVVFKPKSGTSADGQTWTNQGIVLCDLANPKMEVTLTLWNHAPYGDNIKGQVLTVLPGPKGGLVGAGSYDKTKPDGSSETIYKVSASKACDVTIGGGQPAAASPTPTQQPRTATAAAAPSHTAPKWTWDSFLDAEATIMELCLNRAAAIAGRVNEGIGAVCGEGLGPAQVASLATALRIEGSKAGLTADSKIGTPAPPRAAATSEDVVPGLGDDDVAF